MEQTTSHHLLEIEPIIVADIGGTNARFAIASHFDSATQQFSFSHAFTYPSNSFTSFSSALAQFIKDIPVQKPRRACLAVAGPISEGEVTLTNLNWVFKIDDIQSQFDFTQLKVINDFAAFAYAAPYLNKNQNIEIKKGNIIERGNIAVIGPGTGFGAACLVREGAEDTVLSCEGGHITLAPTNQLECQLLAELRTMAEHISVEMVFSGPGLARLYQAMARVKGVEAEDLTAAQISDRANECDICNATLDQFCDWFGSVAGDLAMTFGAQGGLLIGGGIMPRMVERLQQSQFTQRFGAKGKMADYVSAIPVTLIVQDNIPFIGAAACIEFE